MKRTDMWPSEKHKKTQAAYITAYGLLLNLNLNYEKLRCKYTKNYIIHKSSYYFFNK